MTEEIKQKLDRLADLQAEQAKLHQDKQDEVGIFITPEIKTKLAEIDAAYKADEEALHSKIVELDLSIRTGVLNLGASVKGNKLHAIWNKGRVSWDPKALEGYAAGHPEIMPFRSEGQPSVSIRPVKE